MIKLGDKVRFVNENMQGVVTSLKGNTAGVTIEDDFEIPVLLSEIVKIDDILAGKKEEEKPVTVRPNFVKIHSGFHIAFDRISEHFLELRFHNSESDTAQVACYENKFLKHLIVVELEKNVSLGRFALDGFNTWPEWMFVITPLNEEYKKAETIHRRMRFSAKDFHAGYRQCYFLGKQAYTFRLDSDIKAPELQRLKEKDFSEPAEVRAAIPDLKLKPGKEVDLHIEKLIEDPQTLSASEMLDLQMKAVAQSLESAHIHKVKSFILIHGVGNHYLKNKVKNYLNTQKNLVERYADADMLQYGGGATEVWLK